MKPVFYCAWSNIPVCVLSQDSFAADECQHRYYHHHRHHHYMLCLACHYGSTVAAKADYLTYINAEF